MNQKLSESKIRDFLKDNLHLIDKNLQFIKTEYYLKNPNGATGYIDILAKDSENNFVVIEIKRSNSSARETITELSKYSALIRREKNIKKSELRLVVISTEWHELLAPFSEFYHATSYQLEGYHLKINNHLNNCSCSIVLPLDDIESKNLSRRHFISYFTSELELTKAKNTISKQAKKLEINDFVLLSFKLKFEDIYYGATHCLYYAKQLRTKDFYLKKLQVILDKEEYDEMLEYTEELHEDDVIEEFADRLDCRLNFSGVTSEISYPEKVLQRLTDDLWKLENVWKYGILNKDKNFKNDLVIKELIGTEGSSFKYFFSTFKSSNRSKIVEVSEKIENCLFHNNIWKHSIVEVLNYSSKKNNSTITISIFNKDDIIETIWGCIKNGIEDWQPNFNIIIDPEDDTVLEIFEGKLRWNKKSFIASELIKETFNDFKEYFFHRHFGEQRIYDPILLKKMGLEYQTNFYTINSKTKIEKSNIRISGNHIMEIPSDHKNKLEEFLKYKETKKIFNLFDQHYIGNGIFNV